MTISRIKAPDWGTGEKLTAAQMNALDANVTNALDKRSGQTDTLQSIVSLTGAGRIIATSVVAANGDTTYTVGGGNLIIRLTSAITASRSYTLSATGALAGDVITVFAEAGLSASNDCNIKDQSSSIMFVVGNSSAADGQWASFLYTGSTWELYRGGQGSRTRAQKFTSNGTFVVPRGVTSLIILACGGGGGGAGGASGTVSSTVAVAGGGGGAGALLRTQALTGLTPGASLGVVCGAGGTGGSATLSGNDGAPSNVNDGTNYATFPGAQGGTSANTAFTTSGPTYGLYPGGSGPSNSPKALPVGVQLLSNMPTYQPTVMPGGGGFGATYNYPTGASAGAYNPDSPGPGTLWAPGNGGSAGTFNSPQQPGGGGGGGGAGPFGQGGNGGNGGASGNSGSGAGGTAGSSAAANSGGGGGGGGGGGCASSGSGGSGGTGGNGGSGQVIILWVK